MNNIERIIGKIKMLEAQERRLAYRLDRAANRDQPRRELENIRRDITEWYTRLQAERRAVILRQISNLESVSLSAPDQLSRINARVEIAGLRAKLAGLT